MNFPKCGSETQVINSRQPRDGDYVRRRRECEACGHRFTTTEVDMKTRGPSVNTLEKEIETKLRKMVERHGGLCLKWTCPGWSGVPDRIILLPGGRIVFAETKRPKGGKVSKLQTWWKNNLEQLGFDHWLLWDADDLELFASVVLETKEKE